MKKITNILKDLGFPEIFPMNNDEIIKEENNIEYKEKISCSKKDDIETSLNPNKDLLNEGHDSYKIKRKDMTRR